MLHYRKGNLITSDCTVIMHQANCMSVMGGGIAKTIAQVYPKASREDKAFPYSPEERLGKFSYANINNKVIVVNLYGQYSIGRGLQTNYDKLEESIDRFLSFAEENDFNLSKVGVPYKMGCGLAGGDWGIVYKILNRQSEIHQVDIYTYEYTP